MMIPINITDDLYSITHAKYAQYYNLLRLVRVNANDTCDAIV